ncbi:ephrin type-A receptor 3 [Chanos chanos]|uniref:receptor protein-tyrosine kinase n=1 Tax=Chanos chanos TaxID=29144 RepID=A0A6J2VSE6_CHACN|nr:ephrin type-A receptor 3-like [Chanos chanos]
MKKEVDGTVKTWKETKMKLGFDYAHPIYQACNTKDDLRTFWTKWIQRKHAHDVFLDLYFAQETQNPGPLSELTIHLIQSNSSEDRYLKLGGPAVHTLIAPRPFSETAQIAEIEEHLYRVKALPLGKISRNGFHVGFSYNGPCIFIAFVRLFYLKCPALAMNQTKFSEAIGGSGWIRGDCVDGAVETGTLIRECKANGEWGPPHGKCVCAAGHQNVGDSCDACRLGSFKPADGSGPCHPCPVHSRTYGDGASECECERGFSRLPADPEHMGCTRPPSAPVNVTFHYLNDSTLALQWEEPYDLGGRGEVTYDVECMQRKATSEQVWSRCGEDIFFYPASKELTLNTVNVSGFRTHVTYKLSIRAKNEMSKKIPSESSVHSITVHREETSVMRTVSPYQVAISPMEQKATPVRVIGGLVTGALLLAALVSAVFCLIRHSYKRLRKKFKTHAGAGECGEEGFAYLNFTLILPFTTSSVPVHSALREELLSGLRNVLVDRSKLTLGKELGKGEFGAVYEGIYSPSEGTKIKVAVKTMRVGIHCHEDLESFLKEAEIMQHFNHDNVVNLLGVTLEQEQDSPTPVPLVILPYMKHGDLRRFLIATRYGDIPMFVPYQCLLRFMVDIAAGMEYLSSHGFIHRDLAARNCMLGDDLRVRVADFGLSKKIYSSNYYRQKVAIRMPIKWMAIESLSESMYTTKSDVWSFGVTMWEIVSRGRTPYPGVSNHELLDLLETGHRLRQGECDEKLYDVMMSCWHRDPLQRPCFGELGERLKVLLSELPPLEASKEAHYINLGLEAANQAGASGVDPDAEGAAGNVYLPAPVATVASPKEDEEGYLVCIKAGSAHRPAD